MFFSSPFFFFGGNKKKKWLALASLFVWFFFFFLLPKMASFDQDTMDPAQQLELAAAAAATGSRTLWQGDLPPFADEAYVASLYQSEGIVAVKFIRDRHTGFSQGYAFLEFGSHEAAADVLRRYSSQPIPGSQDCVFRLNWASHGVGRSVQEGESFAKRRMGERERSSAAASARKKGRDADGAKRPPFPEKGKPLLAFAFAWCLENLKKLSARLGDRRRRERKVFWSAKKEQKHARVFFPFLCSPVRFLEETGHQKRCLEKTTLFSRSDFPLFRAAPSKAAEGESSVLVQSLPWC